MSGLGETTAMLRRRRKRVSSVADPGGPSMLETSVFGANPGQLRMLSYVPVGLAAGAPLVVVLHGCSQTASDYARRGGWVELADRRGFALVAPEQRSSNNPNRCFNWFVAEDTMRGRGEAASIAAMIDHAIKENQLDPSRVFISGLSAGGAMTCVMLATYPERFAAGAVVAGLPYGVALNVADAMRHMRHADTRTGAQLGALVRSAAPQPVRLPRLTIWHGGADRTVDVSNGRAIAAQWSSLWGLDESPNDTIEHLGFHRSSWREVGRNEILIEFNVLPGLGHGTPLSTKGEDGVGAAGPYMLDVGISSTLEIARFWGLLDDRPAKAGLPLGASVSAEGSARTTPTVPSNGLGEQVLDAVSGHVAPKVLGIIEKALRAAGLKT